MTDRLFYGNGSLWQLTETRLRSVRSEVDKISATTLMAVDENALVDQLELRLRLDAPRLKLDEKYSQGEPEEIKVDVSRDSFLRNIQSPGPAYVQGVRVEVRIPFAGTPDLLNYQPSQSTLNPPHGRVQGQEVVVVIQGPTDTLNAQSMKAELEREIASIADHAGWLESDCASFNGQLRTALLPEIQRRKEGLQKNAALSSQLEIPVKRREDPSRAFDVPVKRRALPVQNQVEPGQPEAKSLPPEPRVSTTDFAGIIQQLTTTRALVERQPRTFNDFGEEALRDLLLVILNNQFGPAGGETFTGFGKADIVIHGQDRPVFIAECKFWSGAKAFAEAIDQLLGYLVWRDTKASLVLFVKSADVTSIDTKAQDTIRAHPQYEKDVDDVDACPAFMLHHAGDAARKITLALVVIPIKPG